MKIQLRNTDESIVDLSNISTTRKIEDENRIELFIDGERMSYNYKDPSIMNLDYSLIVKKLLEE